MMEIKEISFFFDAPINMRDYKRFGIETLRNNGFSVKLFDFSSILRKATLKNNYNDSIPGEIIEVKNFKAAKHLISSLTEDNLIICHIPYEARSFPVYRQISKTRCHYAINSCNAIPVYNPEKSKINSLFQRLSRLGVSRILKSCTGFAFRPEFSYLWGIKKPRLCLAGGSMSTEINHKYFPFTKKTEILWLHTLDYDIYLETQTIPEDKHKNRYAVFIDVGIPNFLGDDLYLEKGSVLSSKKYYPSLCNFFDTAERLAGVKIKIAAHPKSRHAASPEYFGGRETLSGQTAALIKNAEFVITHASTAVSFAVMFNKPLIFITSNEYESDKLEASMIHIMAAMFGKKPLNIDALRNIEWQDELAIDTTLYNNYRRMYIKMPGTPEINSWQIVANRLKEGL